MHGGTRFARFFHACCSNGYLDMEELEALMEFIEAEKKILQMA
jgi:hypothetical protein